jgi:hypothetical protein
LHWIEKKESGKLFREQLDKSERKKFDEMMSIFRSISRLDNVAGFSIIIQSMLRSYLITRQGTEGIIIR